MRPLEVAPRRVPPCPTEHEEQVALIAWARLEARRRPELDLLVAIPNGGHRHPAVAAKLRSEGVSPGFPDLFLPVARPRWASGLAWYGPNQSEPSSPRWAGSGGVGGVAGAHGYHGLMIELKRRVGGSVSRAQRAWHEALRAQGYRVEVCRGWDEGRAVILAYLDGRLPP